MTAPAVEMLWEPHDPQQALRDRLGLADGVAAARWAAGALAEHWDVRVRSCERIVISDHNALAWVDAPAGRLLLKWSLASSRFPVLRDATRLTAWLDRRGLPVSAPVPARDGRLHVEAGGASMSVQRVVEGELLDVDRADHVRAAGVVLARLHESLAEHPEPASLSFPEAASEPLPVRIRQWLDGGARHLPPTALAVLRRRVDGAPAEAIAAQPVHGDFRSANVVCSGPEVVAVLDLEEARFDHRVVELARSAVLLGTRFHDWGPVSPDVHAGLRSGYESVRPLTPVEARWWDTLLLWHALLMVPAGADPTGWRAAALDVTARLASGPAHPGSRSQAAPQLE